MFLLIEYHTASKKIHVLKVFINVAHIYESGKQSFKDREYHRCKFLKIQISIRMDINTFIQNKCKKHLELLVNFIVPNKINHFQIALCAYL